MLAIGALFVVAFVAGAVGYFLYFILRNRPLYVSIVVGFIGFALTATGSAVAFAALLVIYPPNNYADWSALRAIEVQIDTKLKDVSIADRALPRGEQKHVMYYGLFDKISSDKTKPDMVVKISFTPNIKTDDDGTVVLTVFALSSDRLPSSIKAGLAASESVKIWTAQSCQVPELDLKNAACATLSGSPRKADFIWTLSSSSQGRRNLAIKLSDLQIGEKATGIIIYNSDIVLMCGRADYDSGCIGPARMLTAASPNYASSDGLFSIDFLQQVVRFPVTFSTTLGISSEAYAWLALFGVMTSGALGSGWLFNFINIIKKPRQKPIHEPFRPAGRRNRE